MTSSSSSSFDDGDAPDGDPRLGGRNSPSKNARDVRGTMTLRPESGVGFSFLVVVVVVVVAVAVVVVAVEAEAPKLSMSPPRPIRDRTSRISSAVRGRRRRRDDGGMSSIVDGRIGIPG